MGDYERAGRELTEALHAAKWLALSPLEAAALQNLGLAFGRLGQTEDGRYAAVRSIEMFAEQGDVRMEGGSRCSMAQILVFAGQAEAAEEHARAAVELLEPFPPVQAEAFAVLTHVLLAQRRAVEALEPARPGMAILDKLGALEEREVLLRLSYAEAAHASGEHETARAALFDCRSTLLKRAEEIGDEGLRRTFLERVHEHTRAMKLASEWGV